MAVNADFEMGMNVVQSINMTNVGGGSSTTQVIQSLIQQLSLGGASTPVIDDSWAGRLSLTAGALTIALDALVRQNQTVLDLTGKIIYGYVIHVLGASATMTFVGAAVNPYELFGGATSEVNPGTDGWVQMYQPAGFGTVGASNSDIDVTGTGTDSFDMVLIAGTP